MRQAENKSTVKNQLMQLTTRSESKFSSPTEKYKTRSSQGLGMSTSRAAKESRERTENSAIQKLSIIIIIMLQQ